MKLVIKHHRPRQKILVSIGLLTAVVGAIAIAFHYGHWRSIVSTMGSTTGQRSIMEDYLDLQKRNAALGKQNAKLQRAIEIDRYAKEDQRTSVSAMQSEIADLKLELAFYRDILSSTKADTGPHVRGFKLRDYGSDGRFQYRLVLTHVNKDDKVASGRVAVEILGEKSGAKQRLPLSQVAEPSSGDLAFEFKHFRRIEGVLRLPQDFSPREVHVAVYENGRKKSSFDKTYDWSKIVN